MRNPPGSHHRPFSREGCVIFVKLRQFAEGDTAHLVVRPDDGAFVSAGPLARKHLHEHGTERVDLVQLPPGSTLTLDEPEAGTEVLVVRGSLDVDGTECPPLTWLRVPGALGLLRSEGGATFWRKRGHLR